MAGTGLTGMFQEGEQEKSGQQVKHNVEFYRQKTEHIRNLGQERKAQEPQGVAFPGMGMDEALDQEITEHREGDPADNAQREGKRAGGQEGNCDVVKHHAHERDVTQEGTVNFHLLLPPIIQVPSSVSSGIGVCTGAPAIGGGAPSHLPDGQGKEYR